MTDEPPSSVDAYSSTSLLGRRSEVARISAVVDALPRDGGPLIVRGAAGVGKSSLIAIAVDDARERGIPTTSTSGVQVEAHLAFAGLHQLVQPFLSRLNRLPIGQRNALAAAFGMSVAASLDPFLVALGTLELLASEGRDHGLLVAVSDAHWLDDPTARVLSFVARRCASHRFALLIEIRDGYPTPLNDIGLPELWLGPLDEESSRALLKTRAPGLPEVWRDRVLGLAAGNPLALNELPAAIAAGRHDDGRFDEELPLNQRLEYAFGARLAELPHSTRTLAIIAAEDDEDHVAELLAAARLIDPTTTVDALQPAVDAGLLVIDRLRLHFVHPLMRSAVRAAATHRERLGAHDALAEVLAGQPDRRAWHRAAAAISTDEVIAADLERVADSASMRGGAGASLAALERAAELTPDAQVRGLRQLRAAELAIDVGESSRAARLVGDAERSGLHGADYGRARLVREALAPGKPGDPDRVSALTDLAADMQADGHLAIAARALHIAAAQSWWSDPGQSARAAILRRAEALHTAHDDPRVLSIIGFVDPEGHGATIVEHALRLHPDQLPPEAAELVGVALNLTGAFDLSGAFLAAAAAGLRDEGQLGLLPPVLANQAWTAINAVKWPLAITAADEGTRLGRLTGQPLWESASTAARAMIAGLRGDVESADALANEAEALALPMRAGAVLAGVQLVRGVTALADASYESAYRHLSRTFDAADPSYHHFQRAWGIGDFAEAAARSGHRDEARDRVKELEPLVQTSRSSWLNVGLVYARPLLVDDDRAEDAFASALAADLSGWPLYRGRLLFQYGAWLRRRRRIVESRSPLSEARDWFDRHGMLAWSDRARQELRASGVGSVRRSREAWTRLSPQELQVVMMAADGLTNDQVGKRLFLSARTVGSHLYRAFPKLGVTSRTQLRGALDRTVDEPEMVRQGELQER